MTMKLGRIGLAALFLTMSTPGFAEGAIAVDDDAGSKPTGAGYGIGFGQDKDAAKDVAMKKCEAAGNENCHVAVWFRKCGAYASSTQHFGIGWGPSLDEAKSAALDKCGSDACRIIAADCED